MILERDFLEFRFRKATEGYELAIILEKQDQNMEVPPLFKIGHIWYLYMSKDEFLQLRGELMSASE